MYTDNFNYNIKSGTIGGTLLALLFQFSWSGLLTAAITAAVCAATSFFVSLGLNFLRRKMFGKSD